MKKIAAILISLSFLSNCVYASELNPDNTTMISPQQAKGADQPLSEEEEAMEEITTDTGTYPSLKQVIDRTAELSEEQKESVKKAEKFFRQAVISYRQGDVKASTKYFSSFTAMMNKVNLGADINYYLSDEYDHVFMKIHKLLNAVSDLQNSKFYTIPIDLENELVKKYLKIYNEGGSKGRINRALERSRKYRDMILCVLREYGLPEELVYLPIVESLYYNNDLSHAGALGLWQLMPHRARALNLKINYWIDERKDPEKATRAAAEYLRDLFLMFDDWHLALAAYNRGEYGLGRDLKFSQATNIDEMSDRKAVPKETENFVPQFIAATIIGENYKDYGFNPKFEAPLEYDEAVINNVIDLKIVAECANTTPGEIRELNPAIMAWCTPHNYPDFKLKLPKGTKELFLEKIALVKDLNPSRGFIKYKVVKGDWLEKIAKKFHASMSTIKEDNKLKSKNILRIGQVLIIRPGKKYFAGKNN
ncbi:MAG: transglycosylase SLT domain-containing protein [Elusimicrobiota bacterium]